MIIKKIKPGQEASLLYDAFNDKYFVRIHLDNDVFEDYELNHTDLRVQIYDYDAYLYQDGSGQPVSLDHSPATLGIKGGN